MLIIIIVPDLENTANSMSSNSNSPISLSKLSTSTSGSGNGSSNRRNRKVLPVKDREYDPEKHCGVRIGNMKPCTRSLTCKTHQVSLRRNVEGRSKPFDQLLAEHRNNAKETHKHSTSKQVNIVTMLLTKHPFTVYLRAFSPLHRQTMRSEIVGANYWSRLVTAIRRPVSIWSAEVSQATATNRHLAITTATRVRHYHRHRSR